MPTPEPPRFPAADILRLPTFSQDNPFIGMHAMVLHLADISEKLGSGAAVDLNSWKEMNQAVADFCQKFDRPEGWKVFKELMIRGINEAIEFARNNPNPWDEETREWKVGSGFGWFSALVRNFDPCLVGVREGGYRSSREFSNKEARDLIDRMVTICEVPGYEAFLNTLGHHRYPNDEVSEEIFVKYHLNRIDELRGSNQ